MANQKLELTWIGKDIQPKLEPRILIEDPDKSYGDRNSENMLVFGDNLLALKALEQEFAGRIKCIFIDPPYNTGSAFAHYDDGIEHSLWLTMMRDRLEILRRLLTDDGTIWITIDDNEAHYLKVLCDEVFGRACSVANVVWRSSDASNNDAKTFSVDHNHILVYSKQSGWLSYELPRTEESNAHYKNPDNDPNGPWFMGNLSSPKPRPNLRYKVTSPAGYEIDPPANGWRWQESTLMEMVETGEILFSADGKRVIKKTYLKDQKGLAPSTMWDDIEDTGHNRQAKYELKKLFPDTETAELFATPKPERLIKKVLMVATRTDDLILDSFAGSGTTGAVAHKMGRKWIMVELGDHCHTHIQPRLQKVCDGTDQGGISKAVNWQGGGGFNYYYMAPSLLKKDRYDQWVINEEYNATMMAAAMAKHESFRYCPDEVHYWKQGQSSEKDYIFTTTTHLTPEHLDRIHEEMQQDESLLICCKSHFEAADGKYSNITVKKIPSMLLGKCEFGRDDYSLNIVDMPRDPNEPEFVPTGPPVEPKKEEKKAKTEQSGQLNIFVGTGE
jgi:adenine-specific DNA-methyltransferase